MSRLSYKTLFIILLFLLIPIVFLIRINQKSNKVSAAWWDEMWHYRQAINISSHTSAESNVYITTTINIDNSTKAQADDGDFRFTNQAGNLLPYYISAGTGTTSITFHIKFDSFPAGAQTIYAYYGNPSANNGFSVSDFSTAATNYTIGSLGSEEIGTGPIAHWKFDEGVGNTAYDSSGNNYTGIATTQTSIVIGKIGKARKTSNSSGQITFSPISTPTSWTAEAWALFPLPTTTDGWRTLLSHNAGTYHHILVQNGGLIGTYNGSFYSSGFDVDTLSPGWHHITAVGNGSSTAYFIDGSLKGTASSKISTSDFSSIGNYGGTNGQWFGTFDEVRIYNYARTAEQIAQDYAIQNSNVNINSPKLSEPIVYYKFDEGHGTNANNYGIGSTRYKLNFGVGNSGPSWSSEGRLGKALSFDGSNDYTYFTTTGTYPEFTYSVWIKPNTCSGTDIILNGSSNTWNTFRYNGTSTHLALYQPSIPTTAYWYGPNIICGQWQHLAVTFITGGDVIFYLNGKKTSTQSSGTNTVNGGINQVGGSSEYNFDFHGLIDEVKIYDYALSEDEIKSEYNQSSSVVFSVDKLDVGSTSTSALYCVPGSTDPCSPPVAEWKFEEGVGTTVYDTSGNNNNGIFGTGSSAPTWTVGKIGKALNFNKNLNNFISINAGFSGTSNNLTISLWFKTNSTNTIIFGQSDNLPPANPTSFVPTLWILSDGRLRGELWNGTVGAIYSTTTVNDNQWHSISLVGTGTTQSLYLDNQYLGSRSGTINQIWWTKTTIGTGFASSSREGQPTGWNYFNGLIDQVRIYNYARTPAQIAWDYNQGAPVGWWKFDECQGSIAHDSSGIGNTGAISIGASGTQTSVGTCNTSSTAWGVGATGKFNSSLNFDGTDDIIQVNSNSSLQPTNSITLSAWIKPSNVTQNDYATIILKDYSATTGYGLMIRNTNAVVFGVPNSSWSPIITTTTVIPASVWSHILATYDQNKLKIYINGKLNKELNATSPISYTNGYLNIGAWSSAYRNFNGQIDDVRIYNYALTSEQVKQVYNGGAINFN